MGSSFWIAGRSGSGAGVPGRLIALAVAVLLVGAACATAPASAPRREGPGAHAVPGFAFSEDTFAFPNDIRSRNPKAPDLYANYCFVLARGIRQFFAFARFDPSAPRLGYEEYVERVREVASRAPYEPVPEAAARVVIPGYPDLRAFSRAEEQAVKAGLGGRFWTWVHWTNWRVVFPVSADHQAGVAREIMDEVGGGRLIQLLVTNWPKPELNHTVVAYEFREDPASVEFLVWDPNNPASPGRMIFDRQQRRFLATDLYDTEPGPIRVFRMYYSPWL